jgi:hypothetical protein
VFLRPSLRSKFVFLFLPLRTYLLGRFPANYPGLVPLRFCHPEVASPSIASRLVPAHIMLCVSVRMRAPKKTRSALHRTGLRELR